jgi:hypothetical protein
MVGSREHWKEVSIYRLESRTLVETLAPYQVHKIALVLTRLDDGVPQVNGKQKRMMASTTTTMVCLSISLIRAIVQGVSLSGSNRKKPILASLSLVQRSIADQLRMTLKLKRQAPWQQKHTVIFIIINPLSLFTNPIH